MATKRRPVKKKPKRGAQARVEATKPVDEATRQLDDRSPPAADDLNMFMKPTAWVGPSIGRDSRGRRYHIADQEQPIV